MRQRFGVFEEETDQRNPGLRDPLSGGSNPGKFMFERSFRF
jgi:hypothetical protein